MDQLDQFVRNNTLGQRFIDTIISPNTIEQWLKSQIIDQTLERKANGFCTGYYVVICLKKLVALMNAQQLKQLSSIDCLIEMMIQTGSKNMNDMYIILRLLKIFLLSNEYDKKKQEKLCVKLFEIKFFDKILTFKQKQKEKEEKENESDCKNNINLDDIPPIGDKVVNIVINYEFGKFSKVNKFLCYGYFHSQFKPILIARNLNIDDIASIVINYLGYSNKDHIFDNSIVSYKGQLYVLHKHNVEFVLNKRIGIGATSDEPERSMVARVIKTKTNDMKSMDMRLILKSGSLDRVYATNDYVVIVKYGIFKGQIGKISQIWMEKFAMVKFYHNLSSSTETFNQSAVILVDFLLPIFYNYNNYI